MRDIKLEDTFYINFTTRAFGTGIPTELAGTPVLSVLEENNATPITAGVSVAVDRASVVGLNQATIVATAGNGYEAGKGYCVYISTGTVDSVSAIGEVVGQFTMQTTGASNLELQYDGTGLTGETFPSTQQQLSGIANVGSAVNKTPASYTLTTGTQSSGTIASVAALDGTTHDHTDDAGVLLIEYHHLIGSGTPNSVQITGYVSGGNDTVLVAGYDWVAAAYVQIGSITGQNGTPSPIPVNSFDLFVDMVGSGANEGKVDIKLYATSGLTTSTTRVDQIFVAFSQGVEGYDNGSVWLDTNHTNGNTEVGIDGVARNPASTIADANTLLASTNLHRIEYAPGSTVTFAAGQTDEIHKGHDFTVALGGQDISGIYLEGAIVSGIATATARFVLWDCELNACTFDNAGLFEHCSIAATQTIGQAGTYTYHDCYNESGSAVTIDFAAIGATTVHLFAFDGEINFTNMAAGDFVHITGAGTITTTTCTGGTIEHDGFFEYTDAGGNITEQQSDIKVGVDDIQSRVPAALTGAGNMSSDAVAIDGSAPAAVNLKQSSLAMQIGTVQTAEASANTNTIFDTNLALENVDYYGSTAGGLVIGFVSGTAQQFQTRRIVASATGTSNTRVTLEEALDGIPADADTFIVLGRITELS